MKPRIRVSRPSDSDDWVQPETRWYCTGITVGGGNTPQEAYANWRYAIDRFPVKEVYELFFGDYLA